MSTKLTVRPLEENDRAGWEVLWQEYQRQMQVRPTSAQTEQTWRQLLDAETGLWGVCALLDTYRLAGISHFSLPPTTWCLSKQAHLLDIYVTGPLRGKGAGRALIDGACTMAGKLGASELVWHSPPSNFRAKLLFDKVSATPEAVLRYRKKI